MGKSLTKKEQEEVLPANLQGNWGSEGSDKADLLIPKLLVMQSTSQLVGDDKAKLGDIVHSITEKVIGGLDKPPIRFVPFMTFKDWIISEKAPNDNQFKFVEKVAYGPANADWSWEGVNEATGNDIRRDLSINFFCLLEGQEDELPCLISFRRTGYKVGKKLSSHFSICGMQNRPPAAKIWGLGTRKEKKETNTYAVPTLEELGATPVAVLEKAYTWWQMLSKSMEKIKVVDSETDEGVPF